VVARPFTPEPQFTPSASVPPPLTEQDAPQNRIVMLSSGEAMLVAAPPAMPVELAALGEEAVLVLVPRAALIEADTPRLVPRIEVVRAETMLARAEAILVDIPPATDVAVLVEAAVPPLAGVQPLGHRQRPVIMLAAAREPAIESHEPLPLIPDEPVMRASVMPPPVLRAEPAALALPEPDAMPAWLLHRRIAGGHRRIPSPPPRVRDAEPQARPFDSDDAILNQLAARFGDRAPRGSDAAKQAAIARLEKLIERVNRA
jgi:hypothetical protein